MVAAGNGGVTLWWRPPRRPPGDRPENRKSTLNFGVARSNRLTPHDFMGKSLCAGPRPWNRPDHYGELKPPYQ